MRRLYRYPEQGYIGGVCEGIGRYIDIDTNIVRILFCIMGFLCFPMTLIYLIMYLLLPVR